MTMKPLIITGVITLAALVVIGPALAQDVFIYPNKGQSSEQQETDKMECYRWGRDNSGFDPMLTPTASTPPPAQQQPTTSAGKGLLRGAAGGALVGAISGNAGKGAAIGAATGTVVGGARQQNQVAASQQQQQQWEQQQAAEYSQKRGEYNRAYAACLEGRGYTVK